MKEAYTPPQPILEWQIEEGDEVEFITKNGTTYHINNVIRDQGLLSMRIERKLAEGQENVAPLLLEGAYVLSPYASDRRTVSFLEVGKRIDIRAVDERSGEAGTWVTSPIQEITSALRAEEQRTTV